jgi:acyl-CoA synthetase (AMP-forming)/AMP-acid ligase II
MTLADLIAPGTSTTKLHFLAEGTETSLGSLWKQGESVAAWNAAVGFQPVGMVLTNSQACAGVLLGAIAAGVTLVSIPAPPRSADLDWYSTFVQQACTQSGANRLVVEERFLPFVPPLPSISYSTYEEILNFRGSSSTDPSAFTLVQFTSGSTSSPKGIIIPQRNIVANIQSILQWLNPTRSDQSCSWLPLSHDMGLIGMFLSSLAGLGRDWANGGDIVIMTPEMFLRNPQTWLEAIAHFKSTITSSPNFGFDMAIRRRASQTLDLSHLRVCITGAEPVRAETLNHFAKVFAPDGFSPIAFCPAYGLAECTLAVAGTKPDEHWHSLTLDPVALAEGELRSDPLGLKLVASGAPLTGTQIELSDSGRRPVGELLVRGEAVADAYADGTLTKDLRGLFHTNDLGFEADGQWFVIGRQDDVFQVAGRNIYALDVEVHVGQAVGIRNGRVVAIHDDAGLTVVAESEHTTLPVNDAKALARGIRRRVLARIGLSPRRVILVSRGDLPMTSSGKTQRPRVRQALDHETLKVIISD